MTTPSPRRTTALLGSLAALALVAAACARPSAQGAGAYEVNDTHYHLTNYIQEGANIHDFLKIVGTKVGRVALFGMPLQQQWSYNNTGKFAPTYYLQTDAPLYYRDDRVSSCVASPVRR